MATVYQKIAEGVGKVAGVDLSFSDGVANVNLSEAQVGLAQNVIRNILKSPSKTGSKSTLNIKRSWDIIGIPLFETYGMALGLSLGGLVVLGMLVGYGLGKRK